VAVCFEAAGPSPWTIHGAAGEEYEIVWLIDTALDELGSLPRLLQRLGSVVDVAGMNMDDVPRVLAEKQVQGITTYSEGKIMLAATVAAELGLRFFPVRSAQALTDKALERDALDAAGVPVPARWLLSVGTGTTGFANAVEAVRFPAVLKPRSADGSRNVVRVDNAAEFHAALSALDDVAGDMKLIVEELLVGRDPDPDFADVFSLETVVADGIARHLMSTGRFTWAAPFRETGTFLPSVVGPDDLAASMEMADSAIAALGITDGLMHIELKITPDGPRIIETNGVMGGEAITNGLEAITGVNLCRCAFDVATGRFEGLDLPLHPDGVSFLYRLQPPVGRLRVESVNGLDTLGHADEISEIFLNRPPGSITDSANGTPEYICSVVGWVQDHATLRTTAARINEAVTVRMTPLT
jgi:biotin carboxylase